MFTSSFVRLQPCLLIALCAGVKKKQETIVTKDNFVNCCLIKLLRLGRFGLDRVRCNLDRLVGLGFKPKGFWAKVFFFDK
jgi:hypothetical protein